MPLEKAPDTEPKIALLASIHSIVSASTEMDTLATGSLLVFFLIIG